MGKIDAVGLVFPVHPVPLNNSVFMDMVGEISHELARHEIDLLLIADDDLADKHSYMRMVQSRRVDALIVAHTLDRDPRLEQLQAAGFPFWRWRSQLPQPYAWFDFDNYAGTYNATRWLIGKGHQRIALLGESNNQAFITQRRQGYLDALREAGLSSEWLRAMPLHAGWGMPPRKSFSRYRSRPRPSLPTATPTATARRWRWRSWAA
jgi:LacI family transcriptional regulator